MAVRVGRLDMLVAEGEGKRFNFCVNAKLLQDVLGVVPRGGRADAKLFSDPLGALAAGDEPEDLLLSGCQGAQG